MNVPSSPSLPAAASPPPVPVSWLDAHDAFLVDLDGTLIRESVATSGAARMLDRLRDRYVVVSNNSTDTARSLARKLELLGLPVAPERMVLAGQATIDFVAHAYGTARVLLIAGPTLRGYAQRRGCLLVDANADLVVLALDKRFSYAKLGLAANELRRGARLIVTNPDASHPSLDQALVPETGALMEAIVRCAGIGPALVVGKPGNMLFEEGLRRLRAQAADALVIGDNPLTDAHGAVRLGMRYLLVGRHALADADTPEALLGLAHGGHSQPPSARGGRAAVLAPVDSA
ncbi:5' nucleotidase NucF [Pigmentiphaga soli]|uniref:5' nucleotidase NucF n=1 Tax=Pigmentiphaga soli TaxID=1007095 RepID=A0ABP8HM10_9BURK